MRTPTNKGIEMDKLQIAKKTTQVITELSVSYAVGAAIKNNVAPKTLIGKIGVSVAAYAIGGMVAIHASKHVNQQIDELVETVKNAQAETPTLSVV